MKAKEYLQQLQRLDTMINQKIKEVQDLRLKSQSTGGIDYSKERVQSSPSGDAPFVKIITRMIDLDEEINTKINTFVDEKHKIINQIQTLSDQRYIQILHAHYVDYKELKQIADEMDFSYDYIKHLHRDALKNFEDKILNPTPYNT